MVYGAPGEIRTPDLTLRRRSLYPAELRARFIRIPHFLNSPAPGQSRRLSFAPDSQNTQKPLASERLRVISEGSGVLQVVYGSALAGRALPDLRQ